MRPNGARPASAPARFVASGESHGLQPHRVRQFRLRRTPQLRRESACTWWDSRQCVPRRRHRALGRREGPDRQALDRTRACPSIEGARPCSRFISAYPLWSLSVESDFCELPPAHRQRRTGTHSSDGLGGRTMPWRGVESVPPARRLVCDWLVRSSSTPQILE